MSRRLSTLNFLLRHIEKPHLARENNVEDLRRRFERQARLLFRAPRRATYIWENLSSGGQSVPALRVPVSTAPSAGVLLYFHGGAYAIGSPNTHKKMLANIGLLSQCTAVLPRYRLAPEHPFPAAFDDAMTAYRGLLDEGWAPAQIALGGDSAGGGLMLALLARLCGGDAPTPACAFAFSPWTDLTLSGDSLTQNSRSEAMLPANRFFETSQAYAAGADRSDPGLSPLFADFPNCPPVMLQVGSGEALRDDALRMADRLVEYGADVECRVWQDCPHVWQIFQGRLPEADQALVEIIDFLGCHVG